MGFGRRGRFEGAESLPVGYSTGVVCSMFLWERRVDQS